jgi:hypothetical protein
VVIGALHQGLRISRQARNQLVITDRLVNRWHRQMPRQPRHYCSFVFVLHLSLGGGHMCLGVFSRPWYVIINWACPSHAAMACGVNKDGWVVRCRHGKALQG